MVEKEDISYGVVPVFRAGEEYKVLLIHQISYRGDRFWIFPKGHTEGNETTFETALRELKEETGVTDIILESNLVCAVAYSFIHEEIKINKRVDYYLGFCGSQHTCVTQPQEIAELRWCTFVEAQLLLTHKNSRDVLDQVEIFLNQKKSEDDT